MLGFRDSEPENRQKSFEDMETYFKALKEFDEKAMMRIWTEILFSYCYTEKFWVYSELAQRFSRLIHHLKSLELAVGCMRTFYRTMLQNRNLRDVKQMHLLLQLFLRETLQYCFNQKVSRRKKSSVKRNKWSDCKQLLSALQETFEEAPNEISTYLCDIYLSELATVTSGKMSTDELICAIHPFLVVICDETRDMALVERISAAIFRKFTKEFSSEAEKSKLEGDEAGVNDEKLLCFTRVSKRQFRDAIFDWLAAHQMSDQKREQLLDLLNLHLNEEVTTELTCDDCQVDSSASQLSGRKRDATESGIDMLNDNIDTSDPPSTKPLEDINHLTRSGNSANNSELTVIKSVVDELKVEWKNELNEMKNEMKKEFNTIYDRLGKLVDASFVEYKPLVQRAYHTALFHSLSKIVEEYLAKQILLYYKSTTAFSCIDDIFCSFTESSKETTTKYRDILPLLNLDRDCGKPTENDQRITEILQSLLVVSEVEVKDRLCREWLTSEFPHCCGLDEKHSVSYFAPSFQTCLKFDKETDSKYRSNLQIIFSGVAPMLLLFSDSVTGLKQKKYQLLADLIDRILMLKDLNELLTLVVGFAITGEECHLVIYKRNHSNLFFENGKISESYYFYPIAIDSVVPLWHAINQKARNNSTYFALNQLSGIAEVVASLGYRLGYSRTIIKKYRRDCIVCKITPGSQGGKHLVTSTYENSFTIKYSTKYSGRQEIAVLHHLMRRDCPAIDYVIGTCWKDTVRRKLHVAFFKDHFLQEYSNHLSTLAVSQLPFGINHFKPGELKRCFDTSKVTISTNIKYEDLWWNFPKKYDEEYTAVIMYTALDAPVTTVYQREISRQLSRLHDAGVVHVDIRNPNMLLFDLPFRTITAAFLIDFDLSRIIPDHEEEIEVSLLPGPLTTLIRKFKHESGIDCITDDDEIPTITWSFDTDRRFFAEFMVKELPAEPKRENNDSFRTMLFLA